MIVKFALLFSLVASAAPATKSSAKGQACADPFCVAVRRVLDARRDGFYSLRGKRTIFDFDREGRVLIPGFERCWVAPLNPQGSDIHIEAATRYECVSPKMPPAAAKSAHDQWLADLARAIPARWSLRSNRDGEIRDAVLPSSGELVLRVSFEDGVRDGFIPEADGTKRTRLRFCAISYDQEVRAGRRREDTVRLLNGSSAHAFSLEVDGKWFNRIEPGGELWLSLPPGSHDFAAVRDDGRRFELRESVERRLRLALSDERLFNEDREPLLED